MEKSLLSKINNFNNVMDQLNSYILEKEEFIYLCKIALVAKKNLFVLGEPGLSKTFVIDEIVKKIDNVNYFKTLMTKEKSESQLFGRIDIPSLINGDTKVLTKGMLPEAHIAYLDEIFKSNDVCLNSLLQYLNFEKLNIEGTSGVKAPTICTFSASNEIPDFDDEDNAILRPLYDRFQIKYVAESIKEKDNYLKAVKAKRLRSKSSIIEDTIPLEDILSLNEAVLDVAISDECDEMMWRIAEQLKIKLGLKVSDRKLIEYSPLVQAAALLDGRDTVVPDKDFPVLKYYLWEKESQINDIETIISENTISAFDIVLNTINEDLVNTEREFIRDIEEIEENKDGENPRRIKSRKTAKVQASEKELSLIVASLYENFESYQGADKSLAEKRMNETIEKIERVASTIATKAGFEPCSIVALAKQNRLI